MDIIDATNNKEIVRQLSSMLLDGFSDTGTTAWSTPEECVKEVSESLEKGKISRIAVGDSGEALGWTVGTPEYDGTIYGSLRFWLSDAIVSSRASAENLSRILRIK